MKNSTKSVPIIDIFAGPGGLGEGFSAFRTFDAQFPFHIALSIEKETFAYQTLVLRTFFRQFRTVSVPDEYYDYLRNANQTESDRRKRLFDAFPKQVQLAEASSLMVELGKESVQTVRNQIRDALKGTEEFVLLGGPPCQAYSVMGRSRNLGNPNYNAKEDKRHSLYVEYLQILADHRPVIFVMENVKGLLSATLENQRIFERIINDLHSPCEAILREGRSIADKRRRTKYNLLPLVHSGNGNDSDLRRFVVKMEKYGIPQARHRLIILGIRNDLCHIVKPTLPETEAVPAGKIILDLPSIRSGLSRETDSLCIWKSRIQEIQNRKFLSDQPGLIGDDLKSCINEELDILSNRELSRGAEFMPYEVHADYRPDWFIDNRLQGVCNHTTRLHITDDLHRYLYASCYAKVNARSPDLKDFPAELLPQHRNAIKAAKDGTFDDRFRVQLADRPSATVPSHLAKDGHYFIHPDPSQCRSMTVREVARLQTFPDNYFFCGPRTAQYIQVGNAVPPLLAYQIAGNVYKILRDSGLVK